MTPPVDERERMDLRLRSLDAQMACAKERKVLRKIFVLFKDMPHLWNKKHREYGSSKKMKDLYTLLRVYQMFDPHATINTIRRKLNTLMTLYVKEWQRVKVARRCYPDEPHKYTPTVWHFKDMSFMESAVCVDWSGIRQQFLKNPASESRSKPSTSTSKHNASPSSSSSSDSSASSSDSAKRLVSRRGDNEAVILKLKMDAVYEPHKVDKKNSDTDVIEKFVESQLIGVDEKQKELALKLISDTLKNAKLGYLNDDSCIQLGAPESEEDDIYL